MKTIIEYSSELPSSADKVVSNDDLLTEILLLLPPFSLCLFKYVSKRWFTDFTLITNPNFTFRRSQNPMPDHPSGFFIQRNISIFHEYDFVPLDHRIPVSNFNFDYKNNNKKVEILQSCNGLLLCSNVMSYELCVYNIFINKFHSIDTSPFNGQSFYSPLCGLRMAFDPSKSPCHYKIIYAREINYSKIQIHVYSSVTRSWSTFGDRSFSLTGFNNGIYWNDCIHWLDGVNMLKLDVEHLTLTKNNTPDKGKLFESHGCLLFLCIEEGHFHIYEMNKSKSGWLYRCQVIFDGIKLDIPETRREPNEWFLSSIRCIVMDKDICHWFIVMEIYGEMIHYPILSMDTRKLYGDTWKDDTLPNLLISQYSDVFLFVHQ